MAGNRLLLRLRNKDMGTCPKNAAANELKRRGILSHSPRRFQKHIAVFFFEGSLARINGTRQMVLLLPFSAFDETLLATGLCAA